MSTLYPDLISSFPENIDSFTTWLNITASDGVLIQQYLDAMNQGNQTLANQIFAQIPQGTQKIIKTTDLNKITQALQAVERFYRTDIEPYIQEQQQSWLNTINQFSYQGVWANGTSYLQNNIVQYTTGGLQLLYLAIANPPLGTSPTNTTYWRVLTIQGQQGSSGPGLTYMQEWNSSTTYNVDDAVTYSGGLWMALQQNTNVQPGSNDEFWKLIIPIITTTYPIQSTQPTNQTQGDLWFNTQDNPTQYYYLETLENPATGAQLTYGYEAYDDQGNLITGTIPTPTSLAVTTNPNKTSYTVGESFDPTGMVVTVTYSNGSQIPVTTYTYTPTGTLTLQDTLISISYVESGITVGTSLTITVTNPIYGAIWDGSSTTKWTRTDAAVDFVEPQPAVNNGTGSSPFDNILPWSAMEKVEDSDSGSVVSIPKYWYKWTKSGNSLQLQIANQPVDGFYVSPAHCDRGDGQGERDVVYVGRYHCGASATSNTNDLPINNRTRSNLRTLIHNNGSTIWQWDWAMSWTIKMLYLVEFADWDCQTKIGYGCGNNDSSQLMGYTDAMQYHTGTTQASRTTYGLGTQYRYIEGLWDNVYDWVDGCYYDSNGLNIILNPNNFSDSSGGVSIGVPSNGYPSALSVNEVLNNQWVYPTASGGSNSTYVSDSWSFYASSPCLRVGGTYIQDLGQGMFYVGYNATSGTGSNIGSRLMKLPNNT